MDNSGHPKRKKQTTIRLQDKNGNRIYVAADMGWSDPYWAKLKSEAIISTILSMNKEVWVAVSIGFEHEVAFTKQMERLAKKKKARNEYFVDRIQQPQSENTESWFFTHNSDIMPGRDWLGKHGAHGPSVFTPGRLDIKLKELFDSRLCPSPDSKIKKWNCSRVFRKKLRVYRTGILIEKACQGENHVLVEHVPSMSDFHKRLAKYIKHDIPLIRGMKDKDIFLTLVQNEKMGLISRNDIIDVMIKIMKTEDLWKLESFYKGLPIAGARADERTGDYFIKTGKHTSISTRIKEEFSDWDIPPDPEIEPGEDYLE